MAYTMPFKVYMHRIPLVMVPRFRSRNYLRPVNRIKHVVDQQFAQASGTQLNITAAFASDTPDLATVAEVETGSTIRSMFISCDVVNTNAAGVLANAYFMITKNPGGNITVPVPNAVGSDDNKRFVFHQEMVMLQMVDNSNPRTLFKGVLKIPRGYQRMAPNDNIIISIFSPGVELTGCIQIHYKEYR